MAENNSEDKSAEDEDDYSDNDEVILPGCRGWRN